MTAARGTSSPLRTAWAALALTTAVVLWLGAGAGAAAPAPAPRVAAAPEPSLLFAITARDVRLQPADGLKNVFRVTFPERSSSAVQFTDRPARRAAPLSVTQLTRRWGRLGFSSDPPNGVLAVPHGRHQDLLPVQMARPRRAGGRVTIDMAVLRGAPRDSHLAVLTRRVTEGATVRRPSVSLFIDDGGDEASPSFPSDLRYSPDGTWVRVDGDIATVGMSWKLQDDFGSIVYIEPTEAGDEVAAGDDLATVESVSQVDEVRSPVSGTVIRPNPVLDERPDLVNGSPYGEGFLATVRMSDPAEIDRLLSASEYARLVGLPDASQQPVTPAPLLPVLPLPTAGTIRPPTATTYIGAVTAVTGRADVACPPGYTKLAQDLNEGTNGRPVFICFLRVAQRSESLRGVAVRLRTEPMDGCGADLNSGVAYSFFTDPIYIYACEYREGRGTLRDLRADVRSSGTDAPCDAYDPPGRRSGSESTGYSYRGWFGFLPGVFPRDAALDLNFEASGKYIYLCQLLED